jgi:hypothetical protein
LYNESCGTFFIREAPGRHSFFKLSRFNLFGNAPDCGNLRFSPTLDSHQGKSNCYILHFVNRSDDEIIMEKTVMTVTGQISVDKLGVTLMHEHFTFAYPGWFADDSLSPYSRETAEAACLKVLEDVMQLGVKTIVDATPSDVGGRDPVLLRNLSVKLARQTGDPAPAVCPMVSRFPVQETAS